MADKPVTPLFDSPKPTSQRAIAETARIAADFGVDVPTDEVVFSPDSTIVPFRLSDRDTTAFTSAPEESLDQTNVAATEGALRVAQQLRSEGLIIDDDDVNKIAEEIAKRSKEGLVNIAKHRDYWHRIAKFAGRKAGDFVATGLPELGLGLALTDFAGWAQKKLKLQMIAPEDRARIENEIMPKVTLGDKEYSTGTSAAFDILRQRMWGWGERQVGSIVDLFDSETGEFMYKEGEAKSRAAREQIPALVSGLGRDLPWHEIAQRSWSPDDPDNFYGNLSKKQIAALAIGDGIGELVMDPLMWVGWGMGKVPALSRQAFIKLAPDIAAEQSSKIARRTHALDDAKDALDAALANEIKVNQQAEKAAKDWFEKTGQQGMPAEWAKRQILARQRTNNERLFVANLSAESGPATPIMLRRTPRNVPEAVTTEEMEPYVAGMKEVGLGPIEPIGTPEQVISGQLPSPKTNEMLRQLEVKLAHLKTLREGIPSKIINAMDTMSQQPVMPNQEERAALTAQIREVEQQINTIYETGGIHSFTLLEPKIQFRKSSVAVTDPAKELADDAARELSRDYDLAPDFTGADAGIIGQRQLFGPDDAEQAGDVLNLYARTGGTTGQHAFTHGTAIPEYRTSPASPVELIDWRKIDIANQQTKTERELSRQLGHMKSNDLMTSTARAVARQEDILRRNLGEARRLGNKPLIKEYEAELAATEKAKKLIAEDPWHAGTKEFDDSWLPKETKGIMEDPAKYNGWLRRAGNRAVRGLYPGSLQLITYEAWRGSKLYAPLREPMRFFDAYAPGSWKRFRGSMYAYDSHTSAFRDRMDQLAIKAGVQSERSKWNPAKDYSKHAINEELDTKLFDFANTKRYLPDGTTPNPEYQKLADELTPDQMRFANEVRKTMEQAARQQGIDDTNLAIEDYIRHVFTIDQFKDGMRPIEYIGLPTKPEVFASHLMPRTGKEGYKHSMMLALELYNRAMHRKLIMEPLYNDIIQTGTEMAKKFDSPVLQTYANDFVDELRGKPSTQSKHIESWLNKNDKKGWQANDIDEALMGITGLAWAGTLPMNPRYPIMQISTGVITTASRFGLWRTVKGIMKMATPEGQKIAKSVGLTKSYQQFFESNVFRNVNEFLSKRGYSFSPFGIMSTAQTEFATRGITFHAAQDMLLTKYGFATREAAAAAGMLNRIDLESIIHTEAVNHMFGAAGRSPYLSRRLSRPVVTSATQFLSFIPKQTEELAAQAMKNPGKIIEYLAFSGYYSWLLAHNTGIDVTNYVGAGYLNLKPDQLTSPAVDLAGKFFNMANGWSSLDPDKADKTTTEFLDAAKILLVPGGAGITTATRGAERLVTGEQLTMDGIKMRNLDFKHTDFINNPSLETLGTAMAPDRAEGQQSKLGNVGGDFIPTLFGQQSIRDALYARGAQANRRESIRFARELRNLSQDIASAIEDGDMVKADELTKRFEDTTKIRVGNLSGVERAVFMRNVSQIIRDVEDDPILMDRFFKIANDFGMEMEP